MRRAFVVLTIIVSSFGFISAASPAVASAANCSAGQSTTYWNGLLNFDANLYNCTGVDAVEFRNTSVYPSYWDDRSLGGAIFPTPSGILQMGGPGMTGATLTFSHQSWCGGAVHVVATVYQFRIHNAAKGTWGTLFRVTSNAYAINC